MRISLVHPVEKVASLAGPDGRDLEPHEPEAGLDALHALEAPDVDEAAALHLLPHEHGIDPVHAGLEIFRRVDDEDLIDPLAAAGRTEAALLPATLIAVAVWPGMLPMMQL